MTQTTERSISEILRDHGFWHRPSRALPKHEILSLNTNEVVAVADAAGALKVVGIEG